MADLAKAAKIEMTELEQVLAHLLDSGVLARGQGDGEGADDAPETFGANTAFVFYAELRRIALKSFAAAEPLRAMLQSKFRSTVLHAFVLGENTLTCTSIVLLVHGDLVPDRTALDQALKKLLKTGAIRQHVHVDVIAERRFKALKAGDALHAQLAADTCIDISPSTARKAKPLAAEPLGLLERARRRLAQFGA